ncbi:MAG: hypothetical protein HQL91_02160 [Magnetococcales bacterium]|nr:hypothetical protein [Magnetococcales bacterium]
MKDRQSSRRLFLMQSLLLGVAFGPMGCAPVPIRQGIRRMEGEARLGDRPIGVDGLVRPGETVQTGAHGRLVLVMGEDAFLLGPETRLQFHAAAVLPEATPEPEFLPSVRPDPGVVPSSPAQSTGYTLHSGRVLSVFGRGPRALVTPTATIGIRGTGLFLEVAPEQDYLCLCYGRVEIRMKDAPQHLEHLEATHHSARYLAAKTPVRKAPMLHHTDEELYMLEALVHRVPPFDGEPPHSY